MSFDAKTGILKAINETNDPAMKTVLLLLLGVFEEIGSKIDSLLTDEKALRALVLNGHEPVHHKHHEWIAERMAKDEEVREVVGWVKAHMKQEADARASQRKVRDDVLVKVLSWAAIAFIAFTVGAAGIFK